MTMRRHRYGPSQSVRHTTVARGESHFERSNEDDDVLVCRSLFSAVRTDRTGHSGEGRRALYSTRTPPNNNVSARRRVPSLRCIGRSPPLAPPINKNGRGISDRTVLIEIGAGFLAPVATSSQGAHFLPSEPPPSQRIALIRSWPVFDGDARSIGRSQCWRKLKKVKYQTSIHPWSLPSSYPSIPFQLLLGTDGRTDGRTDDGGDDGLN